MPKERDISPSGTIPPIFEPEGDGFASYKSTPALASLRQEAGAVTEPALTAECRRTVATVLGKDEFYDAWRLFKRNKTEEIARLESDPFANRRGILVSLSELADALIATAYEHVLRKMSPDFGRPAYLNSYKQTCPAALAVIGMGKLGSREMNYESDLDLVFVFSHTGETSGRRRVTNGEYFVAFAQKLVNALTLTTEAGGGYRIDVELRPSGNAGPLVTSLDHFLDHQTNRAEAWERMALARARPVVLPADFGAPLGEHIGRLNFGRELPADFFPAMHGIRKRVIAERARESPGVIDLKFGPGGLMDVEFVVYGLMLKCQRVYADIRAGGVFEVIDALRGRDILASAELDGLEEANRLYRTLEARLHRLKRRAEHVIAPDSEDFAVIAEGLGLRPEEAKERLMASRAAVLGVYNRYYKDCHAA